MQFGEIFQGDFMLIDADTIIEVYDGGMVARGKRNDGRVTAYGGRQVRSLMYREADNILTVRLEREHDEGV